MSDKDIIYRQEAIDEVVAWTVEDRPDIEMPTDLVGRINALPSAQPDCSDCIKHGGDWDCDHVHCHKGKWNERSVFDTEDSGIAEMQSAKCSACGKYHTTPYLYFFDNFNFCPNCGADMRGEDDGTDK